MSANFDEWRSLLSGELTKPTSGVAKWTFDDSDTQSGTAVDVWGNNDATINGATTGVSGANQTYGTSEAYSFDGTNDYIDTFDVPFSESASFTYSLWAKTPNTYSSTPAHLIGYLDSGNNNGEISIRVFENKFQGLINEGGGSRILVSTSTYNTGQWYHIVYVHGSGTDEDAMYLNGTKEESSTSTPPTIGDSQRSNYIGARNRDDGTPEGFFEGSIDDVRVYDKALTSQEVTNLYNNGDIRVSNQ